MRRFILILGLLIVPQAMSASACTARPGFPWPWEGSSSWNPCNGNYVSSLPYLVHNSQGDLSDVGFGAGWRIALPHYSKVGTAIKKILPDGREVEFTLDVSSDSYSITNKRKSLVRITKTGATIEERDHWLYILVYTNRAGDTDGKFVLSAIRSRLNQPLFSINWADDFRPTSIVDLVQNKTMAFSYPSPLLRLSSITDFNPSVVHRFSYSGLGDLESVSVDANGYQQGKIHLAYADHRVICDSEQFIDAHGYSNSVPDCSASGGGQYQMEYDATGKLISMTSPDLYTVGPITYSTTQTAYSDSFQFGGYFQYDTNQKLTRAANHRDEGVTITRTSTIDTFQDSLGRITQRVYDSTGRLRQVLAPIGAHVIYEYDTENRLTSVEHGNPAQASWVYTYNETSTSASLNITASNGDLKILGYNRYLQLTVNSDTFYDAGGMPRTNLQFLTYASSVPRVLTRIGSADPYNYGDQHDFAYSGGELATITGIAGNLFGASLTRFDNLGRVIEEDSGANGYAGYRKATYHYNNVGVMDSMTMYQNNGTTEVGRRTLAFTGGNLNVGTASQSGLVGTSSMAFEVDSITGQMKESVVTVGGWVKIMIANFLEVL